MMTHFVTCDYVPPLYRRSRRLLEDPTQTSLCLEGSTLTTKCSSLHLGRWALPSCGATQVYLFSPESVTRQLAHSPCNPFRQCPPPGCSTLSTSLKGYMTTTHPPSCVEDFVYRYRYVRTYTNPCQRFVDSSERSATLISNGTS